MAGPFLRLALVGSFAALAGSTPGRAQDMQQGEPAIIQNLLPTVVNVTALTPGTPDQTSGTAEVGHAMSSEEPHVVVGSGFVIDPSGVIVTNLHVVNHAYKVTVTFSDGSRYPAKVMSASRVTDVAVLQVDAGRTLAAAHWGNSDKLAIGDPVIAVGNPLGIGESVTSGIVSGLNRDIMESPYDDFIQTDAAINHGNSGGALFNKKGEVIGINTAIVSPTAASAGLGFAIPSNDASFIVNQLRRDGALRPGWVGFKIQQITPEMAQALGMTQPQGSIVSYVTPGGPAEKAGMQVGDVVVSIDGAILRDERATLRDIAKTASGQTIKIGVLRAGQPVSLTATVSTWPKSQWNSLDSVSATPAPLVMVPPDLGLTLGALTEEVRTKFTPAVPQSGVLVTGVARWTDAAQRGLAAGDAILQVGDRKVSDPAMLRSILGDAEAAKTPFIMVLVMRRVQTKAGPSWIALRAGG